MKKLLSFLIAFSFIKSTPEEIKARWLKHANSCVQAEKEQFLTRYRIEDSELLDQDLVNKIKSTQSDILQKEIKPLINFQANNALIQPIIQKVFKEEPVIILDNENFEWGMICVSKDHTNNQIYVTLNLSLYLGQLELLEEILLHEYAHILNEDSTNREILECLGWTHSEDESETVNKYLLPFNRNCETRADIYAAVNSPYHGKFLLEFLKTGYQEDGKGTHPCTDDRVALLEKIRESLE